MPRYYFHLFLDDERHADEEGTELADDGAACREALDTATELIGERLKDGWVQSGRNVLAGSIEVTDEAGSVVVRQPFDEALTPR